MRRSLVALGLAELAALMLPAVAAPNPAAAVAGPCANTGNIVDNSGFESGSLSPWVVASGSVPGRVASGGSTYAGGRSSYSLATGGLVNNDLFTVSQVLATCPGEQYTCDFDYNIKEFYQTKYPNGNTYVPYVHVYINYDPNQGNTGAADSVSLRGGQGGQWLHSTFTFTATGNDSLEFDLASPEPQKQGCNYARLDNIVCSISPT